MSLSRVKDKKWFVLGAGGQARVVIATARAVGLSNPQACLVDDGSELTQAPILGIPLLSSDSVLDQRGLFFPAIGNNESRKRLIKEYCDRGWQSLTLCHPGALVERDVRVGAGTIISLGVLIQTGAKLGDGVIVNTGAIVEHDVEVGDYCHIAPGSIILGEALLGEGVLVGGGSRILPRVKVGEYATIGAGSVVIEDVPPRTTVVGVPARIVKGGAEY